MFCAYCGAKAASAGVSADIPSGTALSGSKISGNIILGEDGKYRWVYPLNLFKNPTVFLLIYKIFFFIMLGLFAFMFILDLFEGNVSLERFLGELKVFGIIWLVITALVAISYLIYALIMRGKYVVEFEMDEKGITHRQIRIQAKKAKAIGAAAIIAGILTGSPTAAGAGIGAARTEMYSDFATVRKVKAYPLRSLIKVNSLLNHNQVYAYKEDFAFVKEYIASRCNNAKKGRAGS